MKYRRMNSLLKARSHHHKMHIVLMSDKYERDNEYRKETANTTSEVDRNLHLHGNIGYRKYSCQNI